MGDEYNDNIPYEIKLVNDDENWKKKFSLLFNIKKENDLDSPSEIFKDKNDKKLFYFV